MHSSAGCVSSKRHPGGNGPGSRIGRQICERLGRTDDAGDNLRNCSHIHATSPEAQFTGYWPSRFIRDARSADSGGQIVAVMQSTKSWHGCDPTTWMGIRRSGTTRRSSFLQRKMRSIFMVVPDVFVHQPFQMPLIHHDHMVDQITAAVANPALGNAVLPRTSEADPFGLDAEALHCVDHLLIEKIR